MIEQLSKYGIDELVYDSMNWSITITILKTRGEEIRNMIKDRKKRGESKQACYYSQGWWYNSHQPKGSYLYYKPCPMVHRYFNTWHAWDLDTLHAWSLDTWHAILQYRKYCNMTNK